jgi:hypothetical protein
VLRAITLAVVLICPAAMSSAEVPTEVFTRSAWGIARDSVPGVAQPEGASFPAKEPGAAARSAAQQQDAAKPSSSSVSLRSESRLELVRFVGGEFVKVVRPLPAEKHGYHYGPRESFSDADLKKALAKHGTGLGMDERAQITRLVINAKEIEVEINGGGKHHTHVLSHVQVSVGAGRETAGTPAPGPVQRGGTLVLEYKDGVPDMTPDELKRDLAPFLSFAGQHSSTVDWVETLPPAMKQAIGDHRAVVGMTHEMVAAALGRPSKKVREHDENDNETEDWIYGEPPGKTIFVTFLGDKVIKVRQFPE